MAYPGLDEKKLAELKSFGLGDPQIKIANEKAIQILRNDLAKMVIHQQEPNAQWKGRTLNLVLLGKTGAGKSSTGNLLYGSTIFEESHSSQSCTSTIQYEHCEIDGIKLNIIDTPGLIDTSRDAASIITEIAKMFDEFKDGIHGFLFVYNGGNPRYTAEEKAAFGQTAQDLLGPGFLDHCFVIITHGQDILKLESLNEYMMTEQGSEFGQLLHVLVQKRVILVDNSEETTYGREGQRRQLIGLITSHLQSDRTYSNAAMEQYQVAQRNLTRGFPEAIISMGGLIDEKVFEEVSHLSAGAMSHMSDSGKREIIDSVVRKVQDAKLDHLPPVQLRQAVSTTLDDKVKRYTHSSFLKEVAAVAVPLLRAAGVLFKEAVEKVLSDLVPLGITFLRTKFGF